MLQLNYYSHLLLHSKYSFIIKLAIIFFIYSLFYLDNTNDIAYCAKGQSKKLEKALTEIEELKTEKANLIEELNRFHKDGYTQLLNTGEENLNTLKQKIEAYRVKNQDNFKTVEELEAPSRVIRTGALRPDLTLGPEIIHISKYENVTSDYIHPHVAENLYIDKKYIDETGKEIFDLHRNYRLRKHFVYGEHSQFDATRSWFVYDYTERYKEVLYPANHPANNFDPCSIRLRKLLGREFYEKQLQDQVEDAFNQNCSIS